MTQTTQINHSNQTNPSTPFTIQLGVAANLVKGYAAGWDPTVGKLDILNRPQNQPMTPQIPRPSGENGKWSYPVISLHETVESLTTALLDYTIDTPAIDNAPPLLPSGALLMSSPTGQKAKEALAKTLGISLTDPTLRYVLVKMTRLDQTLFHTTKVDALKPDPRIGIDPEFMRSMARLRHFPVLENDTFADLTQADAKAYLDHFAHYGTHFVSSISVGDQIIQVFAYDATRFGRVKEGVEKNNFSGGDAVTFRYYTTDANKGRFGYVKEYGKIICLSNNTVFKQSLNTGKWHEAVWAEHNSVFQIFSQNTSVDRVWLNENLSEKAPIGFTLAPMTTFTEYKRATVWRHIFKAAMSTVFGKTINPNFTSRDTTDFSHLIPENEPGLISRIASPSINVYKTRLDLAEMQLTASSEVQNFLTYGYVVGGRSKNEQEVDVPGDKVGLFGYILDMRTTGKPNVVSLNVNGFNGLTLGCAHFLGAARFQTKDDSQHFLVVDGLRYELDEKGNPSITDDIRRAPPATFLPKLRDSLEFSLAFGEAVLSVQTGSKEDNRTEKLARDYLRWLGKIIPADTSDNDLLTLRFRALDLANNPRNTGHGTFVPILPAADYEKSVNNILNYLTQIEKQIHQNTTEIKLEKQAKLTTDIAQTLNQNIVQTGKKLSGMITTNLASVSDMSRRYEAVITAREGDSEQKNRKIDQLSSLVSRQQAEVGEAVQSYKAVLAEWQTMEAVKFGLDVASNILNLSSSVMIPSKLISGVKDIENLARTFQLIQKTMNVTNAIAKVYTSASDSRKNMLGAQKTLEGLDNTSNVSIDALGWDELSFHIDAVLATAPKDPRVDGAKANLVAAVKILSARGKALLTAQSDLLQLRREIYTIRCDKELNQRQLTRLKRLTHLVDKTDSAEIKDLNREEIDLIGLTGSLDYLRSQMFKILVKSFLFQDEALQYQWMQAPTPITSYSILNLSKAIVDQNEATIEAKSRLNRYQVSTTNPISIDIRGVLKEDIINGNVREITLNPHIPEFSQYVNLRVHAVVAEVLGVKSTTSKKLQVKLTFDTQPFTDRDIRCTDLRFHTPSRERIYEFNVLTGERHFADQGESWSDGVSPVTPFGAWLVSLPKTTVNDNLVFAGPTVDIRLTFILKARSIDTCIPSSVANHQRVRRQDPLQPSEETLTTEIANAGSLTNGWDVVFNMKLEAINRTLKDQFPSVEKMMAQKEVKFETARVQDDFTEGQENYWEYKFKFSYPELQFKQNNGLDLDLKMHIIEGSITPYCRQAGDSQFKMGKIKSLKDKELTADIKLDLVEGKTVENNKILDIKLIMKNGSFSIRSIQMQPEAELSFNEKVKSFLSKNEVEFLINRLDLTHVPVIDDLKPNGFQFKLLETPSEVSIFQLFIQTGTRNLQNYTLGYMNTREPLPMGYETSLFIRNELLFSNIIPQCFDKSKGWQLAGKKYTKSAIAKWGGMLTKAKIPTFIDTTLLDHSFSPPALGGGATGSHEQTSYSLSENPIIWDLSDIEFSPTNSGGFLLSGSKKKQINFKQTTLATTQVNFFRIKPHQVEKNYDTELNLKITLSFEINIIRDNELNISSNKSNESIEVCGTDNDSSFWGTGTKEKINQTIKDQAPSQISSSIKIDFRPFSLFALKNLLFPNKNNILFKKVVVPGDMLILGHFSDKDKKPIK